MLSILFINATILVSFIFLTSQFFKLRPKALKTVYSKIAVGVIGGILGILLILYSIKVHGEVLVDFRFIPVVLLAFYTTPTSTFIASIIIDVFRIASYGINPASVLGSIAVVVIAIGCTVLSNFKLRKLIKFLSMLFYSLIIVTVVLTKLLWNTSGFFTNITVFILIYIITGLVVYNLAEYMYESEKLLMQFKEQATRDFLTGLSNVRQYDIIINDAFQRVRNLGEKLSVLALDIDHFKYVNDNYGHDGGDSVLKQLGNVLLSTCRPFDIVARVGGEEFSVILLDCPHVQAMEVAERIRRSVGMHKFTLPSGKCINITISVGVATYPDSIDDLQGLKKQADIELYRAKETGRNKVCSISKEDCLANNV